MNLEDYRTIFLVFTLGLALVVSSPLFGLVGRFGDGSENFSEFWLLSASNTTEYYPFVVSAGEEYNVFVGVGNHMGGSEYYRVCVKFRNGTQSLPNINDSVPSSLPSLYEYRFFVGNGKAWQSAVTFSFRDVVIVGDVLSVGEIVIDGVPFPVDVSIGWDSERNGFYSQLFFELWSYEMPLKTFSFHNRFVGLWLNMTGS